MKHWISSTVAALAGAAVIICCSSSAYAVTSDTMDVYNTFGQPVFSGAINESGSPLPGGPEIVPESPLIFPESGADLAFVSALNTSLLTALTYIQSMPGSFLTGTVLRDPTTNAISDILLFEQTYTAGTIPIGPGGPGCPPNCPPGCPPNCPGGGTPPTITAPVVAFFSDGAFNFAQSLTNPTVAGFLGSLPSLTETGDLQNVLFPRYVVQQVGPSLYTTVPSGNYSVDVVSDIDVVPVPGAAWLFGGALGLLAAIRRRMNA